MGKLAAFEVDGCRCWMFTGDHAARTFTPLQPTSGKSGSSFCKTRPPFEIKWQAKRIPTKKIKQIVALAAAHREQLLAQWSRSIADE